MVTLPSQRTSALENVITWAEAFYDFARITIREFAADRLILRALALTFGTLLSLLPLLAVLFSLFKILGGGEWFLEAVRPAFSTYLAPGVHPVISLKLSRLVTNFAAKTIGGVSFVLLLAGLHAIFASVEATFNLIWGGSPRGKFLVRAPLYWGLFLAIPLLLAGAIAFTTYIIALPLTAEVAVHFSFLGNLLRRSIPAAMIIISLILIYKYLPTAPVRWKSALIGGAAAGILYELSKHLFIFYAGRLVRYDLLYGSLAIIPMAMIWINISWLIALFGIEIAYVYQHFTLLRREQKHIRLSRRQQDALCFRLLLAAIVPADTPRTLWINYGDLAEEWELPPGAVIEAVERLQRAGLIQRTIRGGEFIRLHAGVERMKLSEIEGVLNSEDKEVWQWPAEPLWGEVRTRLEDNGIGRLREDVILSDVQKRQDAISS